MIFEAWPMHSHTEALAKLKVSSDVASALGEFKVGMCCQENYFAQCLFLVIFMVIYELVRECD